MRSYLILRERVAAFNAEKEIQELIGSLSMDDPDLSRLEAAALKTQQFDPQQLANRKLAYQRLDQMTFELLTGIRG
jgi:xylose isomerase